MNEAKGATPEVPAGLTRCRKCGHFKGKCLQDGEPWSISCCCNPHICHRCNTPVYKYRITSNYYNEQTGGCVHVPVFTAWAHKCPDGTKEIKRRERAKERQRKKVEADMMNNPNFKLVKRHGMVIMVSGIHNGINNS